MKIYNDNIPEVSAEEILELFSHRCVRCLKPTNTVHEMETRGALGKRALRKDNRVALCKACHAWAHEVGTANSNNILKSYREKALSHGRNSSRTRPSAR